MSAHALILSTVLLFGAAPQTEAPRPATSATTKAKGKAPRGKVKEPSVPLKPVVALVPFKGIVRDEERAALEDRVRAFLPALDVDVQAPERTARAQQDLKVLGLCADVGSVDCLVQVGALSKAAVVLAGVVSPADGGATLELVGVEVNALKERGRVKVFVPSSDEEEIARAVESAVIGVLRPERWLGSLRVAVAQRGASIYVDGAPRGIAPLSETLELTPGPHALFVGLEGFQAHKATVEVSYKEETSVDVVLIPGVTEPPPRLATAAAEEKPVEPPVVAPPAPPRKTPLRVVMYDIDAVGVDKRVASVVAQLLVDEIRKHERVSVLDPSELRALVGDGTTTAVDARNCSVAECFAEVADALGADAVVLANLTNIEGQVLFGLRRVDPRKQEVLGTFLERVPASDVEALLPLVGRSIAATFTDVPLRPGQQQGVDARASLLLNPPPLPPVLSGSLYAGAAVTAVAGLAFTATAIGSWIAYGVGLGEAGAPGVNGANENKNLVGLENAYDVGTIGSIVTWSAAALLGTGAFITGQFTDWEGYGAREQLE